VPWKRVTDCIGAVCPDEPGRQCRSSSVEASVGFRPVQSSRARAGQPEERWGRGAAWRPRTLHDVDASQPWTRRLHQHIPLPTGLVSGRQRSCTGCRDRPVVKKQGSWISEPSRGRPRLTWPAGSSRFVTSCPSKTCGGPGIPDAFHQVKALPPWPRDSIRKNSHGISEFSQPDRTASRTVDLTFSLRTHVRVNQAYAGDTRAEI
jgi:hypothetical protein